MLIRYSYFDKKIYAEVKRLVGSPYSLWKRLNMKGNGSQRLTLISANDEINDIIHTSNGSEHYINIELRPKGLIIHIRVKLDNWALILPYYTLSTFVQDGQLNIYSGKWKLRLSGYRGATIERKFIYKIVDLKAKSENLIVG